MVSTISAGDPAPQRPDDFSIDGIPFVRMQDVGREGHTTCLTQTKDHLSSTASNKLKIFPKGSILVPKSGASIRLNHRAILGINAHVVSHLAVITPTPALNGRFAYYWLTLTDLSKLAHNADLPSMKTSDLAAIPIPVPPLSEQERIVKLLDEADELRKLRAQADTRTATLIPALFHEMFGDPLCNTNIWPKSRLNDLGRVVTGGTPPSSRNGMFGGSIPFITPGDLEHNTTETMRYVTEEGAAAARIIRAGSTLVCCIGATIGKTDRAWTRSAFNQQINAVEWNNKIHDDYGLVCLKLCSQAVIQKGSQTALPILKKSLFELIEIPVPPLDAQQTFAARVAEIRELEATQAASRQRLDALFQSMLHRAFEGEL